MHSNVILSTYSQVGVSKFLKLGLSKLWRPTTSFANLWLRRGWEQSCSPCWELSNSMWHATFTQVIWGDSWLVVVRSKIGNQTLRPSFGHNLCFKYPNDHESPIKTSKFQDLFNDIRNSSIQWILTLAIALWKFGSPLRLQLPKWEFIWECGGSFLHTLLHSWEHKCDSWASFLACTFASPCLCCEPKVRVVTVELWSLWISSLYEPWKHFTCTFKAFALKKYHKSNFQ